MKLLFAFGIGWGLRGGKEQCIMEIKHINHGEFEENNPYSGYTWYSLDCFVDKTHKFMGTQNYVRDMRVK